MVVINTLATPKPFREKKISQSLSSLKEEQGNRNSHQPLHNPHALNTPKRM
jgi:hypothetical protein